MVVGEVAHVIPVYPSLLPMAHSKYEPLQGDHKAEESPRSERMYTLFILLAVGILMATGIVLVVYGLVI